MKPLPTSPRPTAGSVEKTRLNRPSSPLFPENPLDRKHGSWAVTVVLDLTRCEGALKSRADDSGRDTVHAYVVIGQLARHGAEELRNRPFHRAVGDCARTAAESSDGRNQYDGTLPLLLHKMVSQRGIGGILHVHGGQIPRTTHPRSQSPDNPKLGRRHSVQERLRSRKCPCLLQAVRRPWEPP